MAMAMASAVVAGAKIVSTTPVRCVSTVAASNSSILCSSFSGLSLQTWQKSKRGMPLSLSVSSAKPNVSPPRKLLFTVAKLKTHKAAAKRFRVTGSGKIMRRHAYRQHLLSKKSTTRKNRLAGSCQVNRRDYDNVIGALPYLKVKGRVA